MPHNLRTTWTKSLLRFGRGKEETRGKKKGGGGDIGPDLGLAGPNLGHDFENPYPHGLFQWGQGLL